MFQQTNNDKDFDSDLQRLQPLQQMMKKAKFFLQENLIHSGCIPRYDGYDGRRDSFFQKKTLVHHLQTWAWSSGSTDS